MSSDMVTIKEAAEAVDLNAEYIRQLARSGKIKARQIGRTWLVSLSDLQERKRIGAVDLRLQAMGRRKRAKTK